MKKMLKVSAFLAILAGALLVTMGGWGIVFTYQNIAREKIITPTDASIPDAPVRGPFTLKAQADVIRKHTLSATDGQTFAEMPRDSARDIWITALALTTALNLGIITYAFSALVILLGFISVWTGLTFKALARRY